MTSLTTKISANKALVVLFMFLLLLVGVAQFTPVHAAPSCGTPDACDRAQAACVARGNYAWDSVNGTCNRVGQSEPNDPAANCDPGASGGKCDFNHYIVVFTNALSALVGVVVVAMLVTAGIQYSTAGDDSAKINAAKGRIFNAIFALVTFIFMYALLQWLVPGGLF